MMGALMELQASPGGDTRFERWWNSEGEWVEPPNQRRGGQSGVQRLVSRDPDQPILYCKRQVGHLYRSLRYPFGRPTVLRERQALLALDRLEIRVPSLIYCAAQKEAGKWQALLVTEALEGFISLQEWYAPNGPHRHDGALNDKILKQLAFTLARLHLAGWQHGCCYPKHIFVKVSKRDAETEVVIALLDLEKSRRRWRTSAASRHDLRQLLRHREHMPLEDWVLFQQAYLQALGTRAA